MSDALLALAKKAEGEGFFLASVLAGYARGEGVDDAGLAQALGCAGEDLAMLRLCRAPREEAPGFWEDVTAVAGRFGLDPYRLAGVVKRGWVVLLMEEAGGAGEGAFLMAARDREEEKREG
jgi:hypothetical protein